MLVLKFVATTILLTLCFGSANGQTEYEKLWNCLNSDSVIHEKTIHEMYNNGASRMKGKIIRKPFSEFGYEWVDLKVGTWTEYRKNGTIKDSVIWSSNGNVLEEYLFNNKGECFWKKINNTPEKVKFVIGRKLYIEMKNYELFWLFPPSDIPSSHTIYVAGKKEGIKRTFWKDGSLRTEQFFENGKRTKTIRYKKTD